MRRFLALIWLLPFAAACSSAAVPAGSEGESCSVDADCEGGLSCVLGACRIAGAGCAEEGQACGDAIACCPGAICEAGICAPEPMATPDADPPELVAVPNALDFGAVVLGGSAEITLNLRNEGGEPLEIIGLSFDALAEESGAFSLAEPPPVPRVLRPRDPDSELEAIIRCEPPIPGALRGNLVVSTDLPGQPVLNIPMTTELKGEAIVAVVPDLAQARDELSRGEPEITEITELDIGGLRLGETHTQTVHLINLGSGSAALEVLGAGVLPPVGAAFSLTTDPVLTPGDSLFLPALSELPADASNAAVALTLSFTASVEGEVEEQLVIRSDDSRFPELGIVLRGAGTIPRIEVAPNPVDFGEVFLGRRRELPLVVRNAGSEPLTVEAIDLVPSAGPISVSDPQQPLPVTLAAGERLQLAAEYAPATEGTHGAVMTVRSSDPETPLAQVELQGSSVREPAVLLEPATLDFGRLQIGQQAQQTITLTNPGGSNLEIQNLLVVADFGGFRLDTPALPGVAPGASVGLQVSFIPAQVGAHAGDLVVRSNAPLQPTASVSLRGEAIAPHLLITPESLDFGPAFLDTPVRLELRIENDGVGPALIEDVRFSADSARAFRLEDPPDGERVLDAGTVMTLAVVMVAGPGDQAGTLLIESDVVDQTRIEVPLSGSGQGCAEDRRDFDDDPTDCEYVCPVFPTLTEVCNGLDDDCNGQTDEGYGTGAPCGGAGACGAGAIECAGEDDTRCSTDPGGSQDGSGDERCDGVDNDCDGDTDEGFAVNEPCVAPGACGAGLTECADADTIQCSTAPGGSADGSRLESCNGLDDDCDGDTDEDWPVGQLCEAGGICGSGRLECAGPVDVRCSVGPGGSQSRAQAERCNNLDDDCDGNTDEDFSVGLPCAALGECAAGVTECATNLTVTCDTYPGGSNDGSSTEVCDGLDNDCDGSTDEDFAVGLSCDGAGACGAGEVECNGPDAVQCSTEPGGSADQAIAELCNGQDDDCDGATDEDACDGVCTEDCTDTCDVGDVCGPLQSDQRDTLNSAFDEDESIFTGVLYGPGDVDIHRIRLQASDWSCILTPPRWWRVSVDLEEIPIGENYALTAVLDQCQPNATNSELVDEFPNSAQESLNWAVIAPSGGSLCQFAIYLHVHHGTPAGAGLNCAPYRIRVNSRYSTTDPP